jgi:hypothetical protein
MSNDPHAKRYELQRLVDMSLEIAKDALARQESLLPGFIAVQTTGKYELGVAAQGGADGTNLLTTRLRQRAAAEHIRAAAIYRDVRVHHRGASEDIDAIQVMAELASGESINVFQVYRMNDAGPFFYDGPEVEQVPSIIFAESHRGAAGAKRWWEFWK